MRTRIVSWWGAASDFSLTPWATPGRAGVTSPATNTRATTGNQRLGFMIPPFGDRPNPGGMGRPVQSKCEAVTAQAPQRARPLPSGPVAESVQERVQARGGRGRLGLGLVV